MTHEPLSVPTRLPPPTPIYPSPTSLDRPMDRPPQYRPLLSRSESNPQYPHPHHHHHHLLPRPPAIRTGTSPTIVNGELVITGAVGAVSMAESKKSEEEEREELTTKGRKRKRLAKACSACHVSCRDLSHSLSSNFSHSIAIAVLVTVSCPFCMLTPSW